MFLTQLIYLLWVWYQIDLDRNQGARETGGFTHPSRGGSQHVWQNHWEALSKDRCPGPSMSHQINEWGVGPSYTSVLWSQPSPGQEREGSVLQSLGVFQEPLQPSLPLSPRVEWKEREPQPLALLFMPSLLLQGPQYGSDESCIWNRRDSQPCLSTHQGHMSYRSGCGEGVLILESGRTRAPWGSKGKVHCLAQGRTSRADPMKENSFTRCHLPMHFFFSAVLIVYF